MEGNLQRMELFFSYNMKIKSIMYDMAFKEEYSYNRESLIEYEDKIFKNLDLLERNLYNILVLFNRGDVEEKKLKQRFDNYKSDFINSTGDVAKIKELYQKNISNMDPNFIKAVNNNCKGYFIFHGGNIPNPASVNEYLHYWHALIVNNESMYQRMPELETKGNNDFSVHLYGNNEVFSKQIFDALPNISERADILALSDRTLIMMRGLGHALMIEITYSETTAIVNYFIPKICNYDMVEKLKGISNVKKENQFAKGTFEIKKELLVETLTDLITKIPTDEDMFIEGGISYETRSR